MSSADKTILEPSRQLKVCRETEVLVVGGGPAGVAAALAAARNGADTTLVERYNHLGGMATGGLVILIPNMSAGTAEQEIAGICDEMMREGRRQGRSPASAETASGVGRSAAHRRAEALPRLRRRRPRAHERHRRSGDAQVRPQRDDRRSGREALPPLLGEHGHRRRRPRAGDRLREQVGTAGHTEQDHHRHDRGRRRLRLRRCRIRRSRRSQPAQRRGRGGLAHGRRGLPRVQQLPPLRA